MKSIVIGESVGYTVLQRGKTMNSIMEVAFSTMMHQRTQDEDIERLSARYEFVGRIAEEDIRKKYKDKSVAKIFTKGEQNPVKYIWKKNDII